MSGAQTHQSDRYRRIAGIVAGLLLAGCAGLPEDKPGAPKLSLRELAPARVAHPATRGWPRSMWWLKLHEPALNRLIDTALKDSPDLKTAAQRMKTAEAFTEMRAAALLPQVASGMSWDEMRLSKNSIFAKYAGETFALAMINPVVLRYHVDIWGRDRAALEEALGLAQAEAAEQLQARLLLTAALARGYYRLRLALDQERLAVRLADTLRERSRLLQVRLDTGLGTRQALLNEQARLEEAGQRVSALRLQIRLLRHQLAALCGKGPDWADRISPPVEAPAEPPTLPDTLPFHLLAQRPDVVAARLRADAAAKAIDVAQTAFYPDVNIRGFAGLHSVSVIDALFNSSSLAFAVGPTLELPIFEGGRLEANLKAREAGYDEAVESYNQALVHALQQAADAADQLDDIQRRTQAQSEEVAALREVCRLQNSLREQGIADAAQVLEQRQALELQTLRLRGFEADRYQAWVDLVESLGGGIDPPAPAGRSG
jgi:NodT family efflux transporter outer membrane factor (OMF) lipoprotein